MASKVWAAPQRVSPGKDRLWAWYVGIGAGLMLLGMAASANLVLATIATVFVIAAAMGGGGILMLVHTVAMRSWGWATLWSVCGLLYLGAAASILHTPLFAAQLLTFWLMATFAISGLARFMLGVLRHGRG